MRLNLCALLTVYINKKIFKLKSKIMGNNEKVKHYLLNYKDRLTSILEQINPDVLTQVIDAMITAFKTGKTVYVVGNGGSAATASHMQADFSFFVRYFTTFRPRIIALTDNIPIITAVGNDTSFDDIFVE